MTYLRCAGGKATPSTGDPGFWESAPIITRAAGLCIMFKGLTITDVTSVVEMGLDTNTSGAIGENALRVSADTLLMVNSGTAQAVLATPADGVKYDLLFNLRAAGCFYYWRLSGASAWTFLGATATGATASLYAAIANNSAAWSLDDIRRGTVAWHGNPLLSDGFSGANGPLTVTDGLGHAEGIAGGLGAGGSGLAWHGYAWTVASNKAVGTPVTGEELFTDGGLEANYTAGLCDTLTASGAPTVSQSADVHSGAKAQEFLGTASSDRVSRSISEIKGIWYAVSVWGKRTAGTRAATALQISDGSSAILIGYITNASYTQILGRFRCATTGSNYVRVIDLSSTTHDTVIIDDFSIKPMPISSLMAVAAVPSNLGTDADIRADVVCTAGTQAGICIADVSFHARMTAAYAAGTTNITLDEVTQAITTNDTITIRGAADTTYTVASVGALAAGVQSIVLGSGLVADIANDVEVGVDYASWNGCMWYTDTVNAHMDVIALGVATASINTAATYASGNTLVLWRNGTAFRGYQKDTFIGTQQTIAGIAGPYVCMFSTYATGNSVDNVVVRRVLESIPGLD